MREENKFIKAVTKLIQLTQDGIIKWTVNKDTRIITQGSDSVVDIVYMTKHEGQILRLYMLKYKEQFDEFQYSWDTKVVLEIIDTHGIVTWAFPNSRAVWDLLEAAQYQTSGVEDFISKLLAKSDDEPAF